MRVLGLDELNPDPARWYDAGRDRSDLVILDAADVSGKPVATVRLPIRVPSGLHGNWFPGLRVST